MSRSSNRGRVPAIPVRPIGTIFPIIPTDIAIGNTLDIFDELFNAALGNKQRARDLFKTRMEYPKTDIYVIHEDEVLVFEMSVPGLSKNDLEIIYENDSICVKSNKNVRRIGSDSNPATILDIANEYEKIKKETENRKYLIKELKHSSFIRIWGLPVTEIDLEKEIESSLENGILKITVPLKKEKIKLSLPLSIEIK